MSFQRMDKKNVTFIDAICASAADDMDIAEIAHLISGLIKVRDVQAAKSSAKAKRIERMNAAKSDPKFNDIVRRVDAELKQLGFDDIDAFAKNGSLHKLNEAMSAAKMDGEKRMQLKENAAALGLID